MSNHNSTRQRQATAIDHAIGRRIRQQRTQQRLSQVGLAELVGLTFQQIQKYETGISRVPASRLLDLADALGVEVGWFFINLNTSNG